MNSLNKNNYFYPEVYILSGQTDLLDSVCEKLRSSKCSFLPFSINGGMDKLNTYLRTHQISKRCYFLVMLNNISEKDVENINNTIEDVIKLIKRIEAKTIFTLPYLYPRTQESFYNSLIRKINEENHIYAGIVFLGDTLSKTFKSISESYLDQALIDLGTNRSIPSYSSDTFCNPLSPESTSNNVISALFSMGSYRTSTAILGNQTAFEDILKIVFGGKITFPTTDKRRLDFTSPPGVREVHRLNEPVTELLELRGRWISNQRVQKQTSGGKSHRKSIFEKTINSVRKFSKISRHVNIFVEKKRIESEKTDSDGYLKHTSLIKTREKQQILNLSIKKTALFTFLLLFVVASPFLFLIMSRFTLYISDYLLKGSYVTQSHKVLDFSIATSENAKNICLLFLKAPLVGKIYQSPYLDSEFLIKVADLQKNYRKVFVDVAAFVKQSGDNGSEDNIQTANNISLELGSVYSKIGFLEGEWDNVGGGEYNLQKHLFPGMDISETKEKILLLKRIFGQSELIFGADKPANYLVLFNDSSEIRPTGGKINVIGVLTLTGGKVSNIQLLNFDEVNKNIIGKIEPPEPLKKYFGENYWYLADSNWYVDFPSSAEKAEWFLDKGMNISVDGVVSFDSTATSELAATLQKNGTYINADSGDNGLKNLLEELAKQKERQTYKLVYDWVKLLNEKHILIFSHNNEVRNALNDLGWDGSIKNVECAADCYLDTVGLIESANSFGSENIKKEANLKVSIEEGLSKKTLTIYMENKNNFEYKTYIRVLSNPNSGFSPIKIASGDNQNQEYPEVYGVSGYKEAGTYVEFKPYEVKAISFLWENAIENFSEVKRYSILLRKEPGESEYPVEVSLQSKSKNIERSTPTYSLTSDGVWSYNTNLLSDFESDFFWK